MIKNILLPALLFLSFQIEAFALPDLVITSIGMNPSQPTTGQSVTFYAVVKNQGTTATPAGRAIGVTFKIDGVLTNWSNNYSTSLRPGASIQLTANSGPAGVATWTATQGNHTGLVEVNPNISGYSRFSESNYSNNTSSASFTIGAPAPTPTPEPQPTPTPTPQPTPTPTAAITYGVNGHDGRTDYPLAQTEARFQLLSSKNIRSYRFDIGATTTALMDHLVPLAKKYNILLRPMLYPASQSACYNFAKRYASDVKIWEIGNEQDGDRAGAQSRINAMVTCYKGVKQASDELGANLKTTINIMACNSNDMSGRCAGDTNGDMWFLDMAKASGFNFDYISFHYYPSFHDKGYWMDLYLGQARAAATKYNTKIFLNETNCGEVYAGNTNGGYPGDKGCYDSVQNLLNEVKTKYADIIQEVNLYEMLDEKNLSGAGEVERHFGLMYDINNPKPTWNLLTEFAKP